MNFPEVTTTGVSEEELESSSPVELQLPLVSTYLIATSASSRILFRCCSWLGVLASMPGGPATLNLKFIDEGEVHKMLCRRLVCA